MTQKTVDAPSAAEVLPTIEIPIKSIKVEEQHRRYFDEKKIKELAGSIKKVGLLSPVLLRAGAESGTYRLVAGERRLRAAKLAGLEVIQARVGAWGDQEAAEIQAFENLHRADLTPIEEARAFKMLLDAGGYDVKTLAERVDKSEAYVYRAISLLELPPEVLKLIETGELTPAHGHQLLRVPDDQRLRIYTEWQDDFETEENGSTAKSLKDFVERDADRDLDKAIFPKDAPYAGKVACKACPFNSGNQGKLFDGAEKGCCTQPSCFDVKTDQARLEVADKARNGAYKALSYDGVVDRDYRGLQMKGVVEVTAEAAKDKKLVKLLEEKPEKFAIVVEKEHPWDSGRQKPKAVLVCKDPSFLRRVAPAAEQKRERSFDASSGGYTKTPREKFIEAELEKSFFEAAAKATNIQKEIFWRTVLESMDGASHRYIWDRLGISDDADEGKLWKMDRQKWFETILLLAISPYGRVNRDDVKALGVKVADVEKKARAAAGKAWDEKKSAKKAGKPTAGQGKEGADESDSE